ncbi:hypothetical protein RABR111495_19130 [Rahnella bruchi]|uniref:hypothetical protein n=1 Tax=Rahnella bruchi TaxID=1510573 RepID=UPI000EA1BDBD|nr:hypothetical protein [Rahnella bruchi]
MTRYANSVVFLLLFCLLVSSAMAQSREAPEVESIIRQGFPHKIDELKEVTDALMAEYQQQGNITSLVFYSYGLLKLAGEYKNINDNVQASELAKMGFFYLDEAVELDEDNWRVRYLRARLDTWLPSDLGRCVVALHDSMKLDKSFKKLALKLRKKIKQMQVYTLRNCQGDKQADSLRREMLQEQPAIAETPLISGAAPIWDIDELNQVLIPSIKGE